MANVVVCLPQATLKAISDIQFWARPDTVVPGVSGLNAHWFNLFGGLLQIRLGFPKFTVLPNNRLGLTIPFTPRSITCPWLLSPQSDSTNFFSFELDSDNFAKSGPAQKFVAPGTLKAPFNLPLLVSPVKADVGDIGKVLQELKVAVLSNKLANKQSTFVGGLLAALLELSKTLTLDEIVYKPNAAGAIVPSVLKNPVAEFENKMASFLVKEAPLAEAEAALEKMISLVDKPAVTAAAESLAQTQDREDVKKALAAIQLRWEEIWGLEVEKAQTGKDVNAEEEEKLKKEIGQIYLSQPMQDLAAAKEALKVATAIWVADTSAWANLPSEFDAKDPTFGEIHKAITSDLFVKFGYPGDGKAFADAFVAAYNALDGLGAPVNVGGLPVSPLGVDAKIITAGLEGMLEDAIKGANIFGMLVTLASNIPGIPFIPEPKVFGPKLPPAKQPVNLTMTESKSFDKNWCLGMTFATDPKFGSFAQTLEGNLELSVLGQDAPTKPGEIGIGFSTAIFQNAVRQMMANPTKIFQDDDFQEFLDSSAGFFKGLTKENWTEVTANTLFESHSVSLTPQAESLGMSISGTAQMNHFIKTLIASQIPLGVGDFDLSINATIREDAGKLRVTVESISAPAIDVEFFAIFAKVYGISAALTGAPWFMVLAAAAAGGIFGLVVAENVKEFIQLKIEKRINEELAKSISALTESVPPIVLGIDPVVIDPATMKLKIVVVQPDPKTIRFALPQGNLVINAALRQVDVPVVSATPTAKKVPAVLGAALLDLAAKATLRWPPPPTPKFVVSSNSAPSDTASAGVWIKPLDYTLNATLTQNYSDVLASGIPGQLFFSSGSSLVPSADAPSTAAWLAGDIEFSKLGKYDGYSPVPPVDLSKGPATQKAIDGISAELTQKIAYPFGTDGVDFAIFGKAASARYLVDIVGTVQTDPALQINWLGYLLLAASRVATELKLGDAASRLGKASQLLFDMAEFLMSGPIWSAPQLWTKEEEIWLQFVDDSALKTNKDLVATPDPYKPAKKGGQQQEQKFGVAAKHVQIKQAGGQPRSLGGKQSKLAATANKSPFGNARQS